LETEQQENPLDYQVFALSFRVPGAISHFAATLPTEDVGLVDGNVGLNQFYLALCDFHAKTGCDPIDPVAFRSWISSETDIEVALGGPDGVKVFLGMMNEVGELSTPESVAAILRYRANKTRQRQCLDEIQELLAKKTLTEVESIRLRVLSAQVRTITDETGLDPLGTVMTGHNLADLAESLWELPDFLPTPFVELNKALGYTENGGICKGAVTAILAPSGQGKSTFAKVLTNHWVDSGFTVLYVNYEEVSSHWNRILMTQITGANVYKGELMDELEKKHATELFKERMHQWGDRLMVRHDPETAYFEDLERWLREIAGKGPAPDAIVIDTIQSMFMKGGGNKPRWGQYEEMMVHIEKLAKDMGSAIVLTAQENTNRMKERRDVVLQSDTGGSIAIVQKCTVTIHLVKRKVAGMEDLDDEVMEIQIPKNRITGTSFSHNPPAIRYNDDTKSFTPYDAVEEDLYQHRDYDEQLNAPY
jgi:KaiC/GvpD/RAD55 family RecA-like ATPase